MLETTLTFDYEDGYSLLLESDGAEVLITVSDSEAAQLLAIGIKLI